MPPVNLNSPIQFDDELAEAVDVEFARLGI